MLIILKQAYVDRHIFVKSIEDSLGVTVIHYFMNTYSLG